MDVKVLHHKPLQQLPMQLVMHIGLELEPSLLMVHCLSIQITIVIKWHVMEENRVNTNVSLLETTLINAKDKQLNAQVMDVLILSADPVVLGQMEIMTLLALT
jgi:hypothetical protein